MACSGRALAQADWPKTTDAPPLRLGWNQDVDLSSGQEQVPD